MIKPVGHSSIIKQLKNAIMSQKIGHAFIFSGINGIGKKTTALYFAMSALCERGEGEPCFCCPTCKKILAGSHEDVITLDEAFVNKPNSIEKLPKKPNKLPLKQYSVDAMRIFRFLVYEKPRMAKKKFIIIPEAESLTINAQNAILKVFEEPPEYCTTILISNNSSMLLPTIHSRAVELKFQPLNDEQVESVIKQVKDTTCDMSRFIELCSGSPKLAMELMADEDKLNQIETIKAEFLAYLNGNGDTTSVFSKFNKENIDFMVSFLSHVAFSKAQKDGNMHYVNIIKYLTEAQNRAKANTNLNLLVTDMLIKCWEEFHG